MYQRLAFKYLGRGELGRQENSQKLMGFVTSTGYMRVHCLFLSFCVCVKSCIIKKLKGERKTFTTETSGPSPPLFSKLLPTPVSTTGWGVVGRQGLRQTWPCRLQLAEPGAWMTEL